MRPHAGASPQRFGAAGRRPGSTVGTAAPTRRTVALAGGVLGLALLTGCAGPGVGTGSPSGGPGVAAASSPSTAAGAAASTTAGTTAATPSSSPVSGPGSTWGSTWGSTGGSRAPGAGGIPTNVTAPLGPSVPTRVTISGLGVDAPVQPVGLEPDGTVQVPPLEHPELVGWYSGSPTPGEVGPTVLLAHNSGHGVPGAFARIGSLTRGAAVVVTRADGRAVRYVITEVLTYRKADFPTETVYGDTDSAALRLITCSGQWDPVARTSDSNTVVYAVPAP